MEPREPVAWGVGITVIWIVVIVVIVAAAGGQEPTIEAGSLVTALALAFVAAGAIVGLLGRERSWTAWFAGAVAVSITVAIAVAVTVRGDIEQVIWSPVLGLVTGVIGGLLATFGWLIGGVGRVLLGKDDSDQGIL